MFSLSRVIKNCIQKHAATFELISINIHTWWYRIAICVILQIVQKTDFTRETDNTVITEYAKSSNETS